MKKLLIILGLLTILLISGCDDKKEEDNKEGKFIQFTVSGNITGENETLGTHKSSYIYDCDKVAIRDKSQVGASWNYAYDKCNVTYPELFEVEDLHMILANYSNPLFTWINISSGYMSFEPEPLYIGCGQKQIFIWDDEYGEAFYINLTKICEKMEMKRWLKTTMY